MVVILIVYLLELAWWEIVGIYGFETDSGFLAALNFMEELVKCILHILISSDKAIKLMSVSQIMKFCSSAFWKGSLFFTLSIFIILCCMVKLLPKEHLCYVIFISSRFMDTMSSCNSLSSKLQRARILCCIFVSLNYFCILFMCFVSLMVGLFRVRWSKIRKMVCEFLEFIVDNLGEKNETYKVWLYFLF